MAPPAGVDCTPRRSRLPLTTRANATYPPRTTSPKVIRRKDSFVHSRADSSEGLPSPHDSIYEADYFSMSDESTQLESWPMKTLAERSPPAMLSAKKKENISLSPLASPMAEDDSIIYGRGTVLDTIAEANTSAGTVQNLSRTKSMDDILFVSSTGIPDRSSSLVQSTRRKRSFSVNDSLLFSTSYYEAVINIERATRTPLGIHEIYAEPKTPIQDPPERPSTPPGMPSWTAHQSPPQTRLVSSTHMDRFRQLLGFHSSPGDSAASISNPYTIQRSRSQSASARAFPRFRPPRSVYGGLTQHPFNRAPIAKADQSTNPRLAMRSTTPVVSGYSRPSCGRARGQVLGREVRFTPSTAAQSEEHHFPLESDDACPDPQQNNMGHLSSLLIAAPPNPPKQRDCPHRTRLNQKHPGNQYTRTLPYVLPSLPFEPVTPPAPTRHLSLIRTRPNGVDHNTPFEFDFGLDSPMHRNLMDYSPSPLLQNSPTSRQRLIAQFPAPPSSGASLDPQSRPQSGHISRCWRCQLNNLADRYIGMAARVLKETRNVLCLVCCGYDCDDTSTVRGSEFGSSARLIESPARMATSAPIYPSWQDLHGSPLTACTGSRISVLHSTPGVVF